MLRFDRPDSTMRLFSFPLENGGLPRAASYVVLLTCVHAQYVYGSAIGSAADRVVHQVLDDCSYRCRRGQPLSVEIAFDEYGELATELRSCKVDVISALFDDAQAGTAECRREIAALVRASHDARELERALASWTDERNRRLLAEGRSGKDAGEGVGQRPVARLVDQRGVRAHGQRYGGQPLQDLLAGRDKARVLVRVRRHTDVLVHLNGGWVALEPLGRSRARSVATTGSGTERASAPGPGSREGPARTPLRSPRNDESVGEAGRPSRPRPPDEGAQGAVDPTPPFEGAGR